jgi:hypothetical protein
MQLILRIYLVQLTVNIDLKMEGTDRFTITIVLSALFDPILWILQMRELVKCALECKDIAA